MTDTITITGNVATPPELKRTPNGVPITSFRVASAQRRYDRASGTWSDAGTNWYTVSAFRGLADHAFHSLKKGDRVLLTGRLRLREWENGTKRGLAVEIDAEAIGHDLLWGTTTFLKDGATPSPEQDGVWDSRPADSWAAPGIAPADASSGAADGDSSAQAGALPMSQAEGASALIEAVGAPANLEAPF